MSCCHLPLLVNKISMKPSVSWVSVKETLYLVVCFFNRHTIVEALFSLWANFKTEDFQSSQSIDVLKGLGRHLLTGSLCYLLSCFPNQKWHFFIVVTWLLVFPWLLDQSLISFQMFWIFSKTQRFKNSFSVFLTFILFFTVD